MNRDYVYHFALDRRSAENLRRTHVEMSRQYAKIFMCIWYGPTNRFDFAAVVVAFISMIVCCPFSGLTYIHTHAHSAQSD